jgi:hypothetical protein
MGAVVGAHYALVVVNVASGSVVPRPSTVAIKGPGGIDTRSMSTVVSSKSAFIKIDVAGGSVVPGTSAITADEGSGVVASAHSAMQTWLTIVTIEASVVLNGPGLRDKGIDI